MNIAHILLKPFISLIIALTVGLSYINLGYCTQTSSNSFAPLVEMTVPAVVNISTTQSLEVKNPLEDLRSEIPEGSPFDQFFKELLNREFGFAEPKKRKATSLGSGFIIDPAGFIVTNAHVIEGADEITITLSNDSDKNFKAKLIGSDRKTDLAVLKIESKNPLPFLKFGDADKAKVGDWIIAIGNPFGLGGTVTAGIISAKSRLIGGQIEGFIQTDASINRGNSGGPMINLDGEVIGINSVIISPSGGNVGIGFSIPSNQAQLMIEQLKTTGKVVRGWLGVGIQLLTEDISRNMGISAEIKGVLVTQIMKDSPAHKIGIKIGDIITAFEGKPVTNPQRLSRLVAETKVGTKVIIDILRDGNAIKLSAAIELLDNKFEEESAKNNSSKDKNESSLNSILGMKFEELNNITRNKFRIDNDISGVVISAVNRSSNAAEAGLVVGDVVVQANKIKISKVSELIKLIESAKKANSKEVILLINRAEASRFVVLELE